MNHSKRLFTRYNGFQGCKFGPRCACWPKPEDRKNIHHKAANRRVAKDDQKIERSDGDAG